MCLVIPPLASPCIGLRVNQTFHRMTRGIILKFAYFPIHQFYTYTYIYIHMKMYIYIYTHTCLLRSCLSHNLALQVVTWFGGTTDSWFRMRKQDTPSVRAILVSIFDGNFPASHVWLLGGYAIILSSWFFQFEIRWCLSQNFSRKLHAQIIDDKAMVSCAVSWTLQNSFNPQGSRQPTQSSW